MNKKLLILMSALNANVAELVKQSNFSTDAVIVNQCDENSEYIIKDKDNTIYVYETTDRGLSKSRNLALLKAKNLPHEYVMFADDDVEYFDGYSNIVIESYERKQDATIMIFGFYKVDSNSKKNKYHLKYPYKIKRNINPYRYFSSVRITVKKEFIYENSLHFNENYGTGSNKVSHGEDSLFIKDARKNKAKIYVADTKLLKVDVTESTWRNITDKQFFEDKGKLWRELAPILYPILGIPLIFKISRAKRNNFISAYAQFLCGARKEL